MMSDEIPPAEVADSLPLIHACRTEAKDARAYDARLSNPVKQWMAEHGVGEFVYEGYRARLVWRNKPDTYDLGALSPDALKEVAVIPGLLRVDQTMLRRLGETRALHQLRGARIPNEETSVALTVDKED